MGRAIRWLLAACVLVATACGAADHVEVEQYPNANERREREAEGTLDPVERSVPPDEHAGPYPQDDQLAGENTEPL